ncbi:MAG: hypothetical protein ACRDFB_06690 [Rhabdochlamydiaceae bacterium]
MDHGEFKPSFGDAGYRRFVKEVVDYSEAGIEIIGNNLLCINYPEILHSIREARRGGVVVSVYFTNAPKRIVDWLMDSDVQLYQGKKILEEEEYMFRDGNKVIATTFKNNSRTGYWTTEDSQVKKFVDFYDSFVSSPETKLIGEMRTGIRKRHVEISEGSQKEIRERIVRNERLAHEIGKSIKPEQLAELETSIRKSRERTL